MRMRAIHDLLAEHPFFAGLDDREVFYLAGCGANYSQRAGQRLFATGDPARTFYVVRAGKISIEASSGDGRPTVVVDTVDAGGVVGWSWLIPPYTWHFDAQALEDVSAVALDGACLRERCDEDVELGYRLMQRFAGLAGERMQAARRRLVELAAV